MKHFLLGMSKRLQFEKNPKVILHYRLMMFQSSLLPKRDLQNDPRFELHYLNYLEEKRERERKSNERDKESESRRSIAPVMETLLIRSMRKLFCNRCHEAQILF